MIRHSLFLKEFEKMLASSKKERLLALRKEVLFTSKQNWCMSLKKRSLRVQSSFQTFFTSKYIYITHPIVKIGVIVCTGALIGYAFVSLRSTLQLQEKDKFSFQKYYDFVNIVYHFVIKKMRTIYLIMKKIGTIYFVVLVFVSVTLIPSVSSKNNNYYYCSPLTPTAAALSTSRSITTRLPFAALGDKETAVTNITDQLYQVAVQPLDTAGELAGRLVQYVFRNATTIASITADEQALGALRSEPLKTIERFLTYISRQQMNYARIKTLFRSVTNHLNERFGGLMFTELAMGYIEQHQALSLRSHTSPKRSLDRRLFNQDRRLLKHVLGCIESGGNKAFNVQTGTRIKDRVYEMVNLEGKKVAFRSYDVENFVTHIADNILIPAFGAPLEKIKQITAKNWTLKSHLLHKGLHFLQSYPAPQIYSPFTIAKERYEITYQLLAQFNDKGNFCLARIRFEIENLTRDNLVHLGALKPDQQATAWSYRNRYYFVDAIPKSYEMPDELRGSEALLEAAEKYNVSLTELPSCTIPKQEQLITEYEHFFKTTIWTFPKRRKQVKQLSVLKYYKLLKLYSVGRTNKIFNSMEEATAQMNREIAGIKGALGDENQLPMEVMVRLHEFNQPGDVFSILSSKKDDLIQKQKDNRQKREDLNQQVAIGNANKLIEPYRVRIWPDSDSLPRMEKGTSTAITSMIKGKQDNGDDSPVAFLLPDSVKDLQNTVFASLNLRLLSIGSSNKRIIILPKLTRDFVPLDANQLPYLLARPDIANLSIGFAFDLKTLNPKETKMFQSNFKQLTSNRYRLQFHKGNPSLEKHDLDWKHLLQLMQVKQDNISFYLNESQQNVDAGRLDSATLTPCNNEISLTFVDLATIITLSIIVGILSQQILHKIHENKKDKQK